MFVLADYILRLANYGGSGANWDYAFQILAWDGKWRLTLTQVNKIKGLYVCSVPLPIVPYVILCISIISTCFVYSTQLFVMKRGIQKKTFQSVILVVNAVVTQIRVPCDEVLIRFEHSFLLKRKTTEFGKSVQTCTSLTVQQSLICRVNRNIYTIIKTYLPLEGSVIKTTLKSFSFHIECPFSLFLIMWSISTYLLKITHVRYAWM